MDDNLLISFLPLSPGARLACLALFWVSVFAFAYMVHRIIKNSRARGLGANPLRGVGSMEEGGRQFITGQAHSPVPLIAPVSKAACVFYLEKVRMAMSPEYVSRRGRNPEVDLAPNAYGVFFVNGSSGTALVAPVPQSVCLTKPENKREDISFLGGEVGDSDRAERIITENEAVTVLGTPRKFSEFMRYLRTGAQSNMPPEMITELRKMEGDPGSAGIPCYFGDGMELVTDQSYDDYIARTAAAGSAPAQTVSIVSALLLAAGAGILWYVLMLGAARQ